MAKGSRVLEDGGSRRLERLERGSLSEKAYEAIRGSIISGRLGPGERLIETDLAEDLGVSRAPIREAFRRLADEQLVVERPRHGTYVREFTAKDFVDVYNLLGANESLAVRMIVRDQTTLEPLKRIVEEMVEVAAQGDLPRVVEIELEFHRRLCSMAGNRQLDNVFRLLSGMVGMALSLDDASYDDVAKIASEHHPLLRVIEDAVKTGEEERAVYAIRSHIRASVGGVMSRLGGEPSDILYPLVIPKDRGEDFEG